MLSNYLLFRSNSKNPVFALDASYLWYVLSIHTTFIYVIAPPPSLFVLWTIIKTLLCEPWRWLNIQRLRCTRHYIPAAKDISLIDCNISTSRCSTKHVKVTSRLDEIIKESGSALVCIMYSFDFNLRFYNLKLAGESQSACHIENLLFPGNSWYRSFSYLSWCTCPTVETLSIFRRIFIIPV